MQRSSILALLLMFMLATAACGGNKQRKADKDAAERKRAASESRDSTKVEEPSKEDLADSPCGNSRWAKLPEGSQDKAEDDTDKGVDSDDPDAPDESTDGAKEGPGDC